MIYITGDTHADVMSRFNTTNFPEQKEMTKDDYVIICGDFGLIWDAEGESKSEKHSLNWLEQKPFTTLFIDGNHENYDRLFHDYPVKEWHGGKVHEIRPSILHLMRGEIFEIEGLTFFAFGGASSHDIRDGVLEKDDPLVKRWRHDYTKLFRINHVSWWQEEKPSEEERQYGLDNLEKYDFKVDYVLTHEMPASILTLLLAVYGMPEYYRADDFSLYLDDIRSKLDYKQWYNGHYHIDRMINKQDIIVYESLRRLI